MPKIIQTVFQDQVDVERISRWTPVLGFPRDSRTVRELVMQRVKQLEDFGDVPLVPASLGQLERPAAATSGTRL